MPLYVASLDLLHNPDHPTKPIRLGDTAGGIDQAWGLPGRARQLPPLDGDPHTTAELLAYVARQRVGPASEVTQADPAHPCISITTCERTRHGVSVFADTYWLSSKESGNARD